jgi:hypothetical protein
MCNHPHGAEPLFLPFFGHLMALFSTQASAASIAASCTTETVHLCARSTQMMRHETVGGAQEKKWELSCSERKRCKAHESAEL